MVHYECSDEEHPCLVCREPMTPDHRCYMTPLREENEDEEGEEEEEEGEEEQHHIRDNVQYVFYDFERMQDTGEHIPNLCVVQLGCERCISEVGKDLCEHCPWREEGYGPNHEILFRGPTTQHDVCVWLITQAEKPKKKNQEEEEGSTRKGTTQEEAEEVEGEDVVEVDAPTPLEEKTKKTKNKNTTTTTTVQKEDRIYVMAHNARSYDLHLILKGLYPLLVKLPTKIRNGQQILQVTLGCLCLIPYPLKAFPKSFGLKELKKGTHSLPQVAYPKVQEGALFDLQGELLAYCQSDGDILRRGCADFRQNAINSVCMDPFVEVMTAAAFTMKSFRKHDLKPNIIAILPPQGYQPRRNYSQACMHWLNYLMEVKKSSRVERANISTVWMAMIQRQAPSTNSWAVSGMGVRGPTVATSLSRSTLAMPPKEDAPMPRDYATKPKKVKPSNSPCKHTDEERSWVGTYATVELHEAMKKYDYQVLQIYDVWHFDTFAQHDPDTQQVGLFDTYIDRHFKEKLEASGSPEGCTDHDAYIQEIYDKEGFGLDKDRIEKNPGHRTIAKMQLNSLWGKFGQRLDYSQNIYMNDPVQYFTLWRDERNTIKDVTVVNEHMVEVTYTHKKEFQTPHSQFNVAIAAWITAQARLKLYETLAVVYFDTDSVIYIHRPHDANPELGLTLGEFTDELDGNTIKTFVSGGPKNYGYE
ncbi:uncharacterized protein [Haliotis cracherodii]|uniref:uncharacterized protein n=1 Tax=Haliotis cracherodii TaxID=6455 RepID=UPI0039E87195